MKQFLYLLAVAACFISACGSSTPSQVEGYVPIYQSDSSVASITSSEPRAIVEGGKIYTKDSLLFQIEKGVGIHIINIADPENPEKTGFINIMGVSDMSIKGQLLYANNFNDLVIVDISNLNAVKLIKRQEGAFKLSSSQLPPEQGYFECIDPSKGKVVGWKKQVIYSPKCRN
jgi:hypothetical protein